MWIILLAIYPRIYCAYKSMPYCIIFDAATLKDAFHLKYALANPWPPLGSSKPPPPDEENDHPDRKDRHSN